MAHAATRTNNSSKPEQFLYLAFELGDAHWKLGFTTGFGQKARIRNIGAWIGKGRGMIAPYRLG